MLHECLFERCCLWLRLNKFLTYLLTLRFRKQDQERIDWGTCCLILSCSLWEVRPAYRLDQWQKSCFSVKQEVHPCFLSLITFLFTSCLSHGTTVKVLFGLSSQAATSCHPVYHTLFLTFIDERQDGNLQKSRNGFWLDPSWNRTRVYHFWQTLNPLDH